MFVSENLWKGQWGFPTKVDLTHNVTISELKQPLNSDSCQSKHGVPSPQSTVPDTGLRVPSPACSSRSSKFFVQSVSINDREGELLKFPVFEVGAQVSQQQGKEESSDVSFKDVIPWLEWLFVWNGWSLSMSLSWDGPSSLIRWVGKY